jgi:putative transposase
LPALALPLAGDPVIRAYEGDIDEKGSGRICFVDAASRRNHCPIMPRTARHAPGGFVYHALKRAAERQVLFRKPADYDAFLRLLDEAIKRWPTRLLAYWLMPTHWHFVLWPQRDEQLRELLRWLTLTHSVRWQAHYHSTGSGHVYQNRLKAFPVETDDHRYVVLRYVERKAYRAGLIQGVEQWAWSSLSARSSGGKAAQRLHHWPVPAPENWISWVAVPQSEAELVDLRHSVIRGRPFGSEDWTENVVEQLGLQATARPRGRPRKTRDLL